MVRTRDGRVEFFVADVSGHDARAASFARELDTLVRALAPRLAPSALLKVLNTILEASWQPGTFASAVCFVLDPHTGKGTVAVAGQLPPLVKRVTSCEAVRVESGPALGLFGGNDYVEQPLSLGPGELLVAVTDGITDPLARGDDPLGAAALLRLLDASPVRPSQVCALLLDKSHARGNKDDATVLAVVAPAARAARASRASAGLVWFHQHAPACAKSDRQGSGARDVPAPGCPEVLRCPRCQLAFTCSAQVTRLVTST